MRRYRTADKVLSSGAPLSLRECAVVVAWREQHLEQVMRLSWVISAVMLTVGTCGGGLQRAVAIDRTVIDPSTD